MMETALYDDCFSSHTNFLTMNNSVNQLKRRMTLDLDNKTSVIKKAKVFGSLHTPQKVDLLSSPDLHMLKLASPELERLIISNQSLVTTTPTQVFFPKNVTEEQELYAKGFADALAQLQQNNNGNGGNQQVQQQIQQQVHQIQQNMQNTQSNSHNYNDSSNSSNDDSMSDNSESNSSSSNYTTNGQLSNMAYGQHNQQQHAVFPTSIANNNATVPVNSGPQQHHHRLPDYGMIQNEYSPSPPIVPLVHVKEEPQTVPNMGSSPPMSPIDMASQEKIKLERKRQRNRVAASKCRKRKLERIARLEDKVKQLKGENSDLTTVLTKLRETVCSLKQQVMEHVNSGCQIMISSNISSF